MEDNTINPPMTNIVMPGYKHKDFVHCDFGMTIFYYAQNLFWKKFGKHYKHRAFYPSPPVPLPQGERGVFRRKLKIPLLREKEKIRGRDLKAPLPLRERGWGEGAREAHDLCVYGSHATPKNPQSIKTNTLFSVKLK